VGIAGENPWRKREQEKRKRDGARARGVGVVICPLMAVFQEFKLKGTEMGLVKLIRHGKWVR
jgi:hypothetical protein